MGIKIGELGDRGKLLIIYLIGIFIFCTGLKTFAQEPNTQQSDGSKIVRIGISDNNFKSLTYNELSFISTGEYTAIEKNNGKQIAKFAPTDILKIKLKPSGFELTAKNKIVAKDIKGTIVLSCPRGVLGIQNLRRNGRQATYHGNFEIVQKNESSFYLVNVLDLEDYLKGVVPNEMPTRFGLEALKAQAVAARNYVLMPRTRAYKDFDVDDSVASQVYFGANSECELSNKAVKETEGLVALYGWDLILAQYCSTAGGYTENYENAFSDPQTKIFPARPKLYLKGRPDLYSVAPLSRDEEAKLYYMSSPDSYDMKSPYYRWQRTWEGEELVKVLSKTLIDQSKTGFVKPEFKKGDSIGEIREIAVKKRGVSGKAMELDIITDKTIYHVYKEIVIRRLLQKNGISLPSANIVFENLYDTNKKLAKVTVYGGGFGHGVGMSQYGAGFMATSLHKSFDKILKRYYTGISISTVPVVISTNENQKYVTQTFYSQRAKAILVVDNKYRIKNFRANINGRNVAFEIANNIVPVRRISRIDISSYLKYGKNKATFYFPVNEVNKGIRLYIELVEKDDSEYNF